MGFAVLRSWRGGGPLARIEAPGSERVINTSRPAVRGGWHLPPAVCTRTAASNAPDATGDVSWPRQTRPLVWLVRDGEADRQSLDAHRRCRSVTFTLENARS